MGEGSVNQYLVLRIERDGLHLGYRIDFAETPAATELRALDANGDGTLSDTERQNYLAAHRDEWASRVTLTVNGKERDLKVTDATLKLTDGSDGRKTLLVMLDLTVDKQAWNATANRAEIAIGNYSHIPGWREAAVLAGDGCWVVDGTKRAKAKVLDSRAETGDEAKDWTMAFGFETKGTAATTRANQ
jgi:hypothetical protein